MKKITTFLFLSMFFLACNNPEQESNDSNTYEEQLENKEPIGGDKDANGCLIAAGETWSQLKQNCIRVFDEALRLNPVKVEEGDAIISAFVLAEEENKSLVELFIGEEESSVILEATSENLYENGKYKYDAINAVLFIDEVEAYKAD